MSKSIQALREQKAALAKEVKNQIAEKGDQVWTKEDKTKFDGIADQIESLDGQIDTMQRLANVEAERHFTDTVQIEIDPAKAQANQRRKIMDKMLRGGVSSLNAEEIAQIRNTMSTTTGSQGGFSVQSDVASIFIDSLKGYRGMREEAANITTAQGNPLSYPATDGTSETGEVIAENTTATGADIVFSSVSLNTFKFGSKVIAIPIELLQDSTIDIVALVNKRIRDRIGRIQNTKFTIGSGSGEPNGLVTASSTGKTGTTGQTLTVIYDDLVDLIESVDYAYDSNAQCFMFSQSIRKVVRKIKDTAGRPIWTPSYDAGIANKSPDQLLGYDVCLNNDMPVPAANAKSIAFGDISNYMVRDALDIALFRFEDSAYAKLGQVGFLAWARAGGNLLDTAAVKLYAHSAT
jgi:HK97 family phage major capsid protein